MSRPMARITPGHRGNRTAAGNGTAGGGGRIALDGLIAPDHWQGLVREALRIALVNLRFGPRARGSWTWCWDRGGPASAGTQMWATGLRATNRKYTAAG